MDSNLLFLSQLNYKINVSTPDTSDDAISYEDIEKIDLRKCRFEEFCQAIKYVRDKNPDFTFRDFSLDAIKPANFIAGKTYNFIELTDFAKHTSVTIGNMTLFSELQKISSAAEYFVSNYGINESSKNISVLSFQDYDNYSISESANTLEEIGSIVVAGGNDGAIKVTATFHESSTAEHPIISIRFFALNTGLYLTNRDIIDISTIYKPNATIVEAFAYLSYTDYLNNHFNYSFDKLMISGDIILDNMDDLYSNHYDLTKII